MTRRIALALYVAPALLGGCGLQPLYSGGASGPAATPLQRISVGPIQGKAGWLMANALRDRLPASDEPPLFRLDIRLDDTIAGLGVRADDSVSRERRTLRARYQLVDLNDGSVVLDATAGSDAGIDVVQSEYATIAAENTAMERLSEMVADKIVNRLALYTRRRTIAK